MTTVDVKCLVCGKVFIVEVPVEVHEKYSGWTWMGLSSLPKHECNSMTEKE